MSRLGGLCAGYKAFFNDIDRPMRIMAELLRRGRYADEVMNILGEEAKTKLASVYCKTERNDPWPCGSGRKFKRCHGATQYDTKL